MKRDHKPAAPRPAANANAAPAWGASLPLGIGMLALVVLIGGLGAWSVTARIAGAVVTSGMIEVESNRQVIQHPDGGVVGAIHVKEGDVVAAGDVLVELDGTRLRSELAIVEGQLREIAARRARLEAERDTAETMDVGPALRRLAEADPEFAARLEGERRLFEARRTRLAQEVALLGEQNAQISNRIEGLGAQIAALDEQAGLIEDELSDQRRLLEQRLTQASRVSGLQRERAALRGQTARLEAEIAELRGQAAANAIAVLQIASRHQEEAQTQLRDLEFRQIELTERQLALADTLSRLEIRAPVGGIVYDSKVFALQSVVRAAEPLMYLIPQDRPLVVSARVNAINIDEVHVGQEAVLVFAAFDQSRMPEIRGRVSRISADAILDEVTRQHYYATEIVPFEAEMAKLEDQKLLPGMPVEAFLRTGERTPLVYLTEPMMRFFNRAFRE